MCCIEKEFNCCFVESFSGEDLETVRQIVNLLVGRTEAGMTAKEAEFEPQITLTQSARVIVQFRQSQAAPQNGLHLRLAQANLDAYRVRLFAPDVGA